MNWPIHRGELLVNSDPKFRLSLFGSPQIAGADGVPLTGRATQRHRIALLSLLALSPGARLSRDKLMAYLWPESDTEHARTLLNQAVYVVRRVLGEAAILSAGDELQLNAHVVDLDVAEFEAARASGDHLRMAELYRGPFLDGFFLHDAPEFGDWQERERHRLAAEHAAALEAAAEAAEDEQDVLRAVKWWRARAALDPYDSRVALRLMDALVASGNRAGALQEAAAHQRLLQVEFGIEPPAEMLALAERLRSGPSPPSLPVAPRPHPRPPAAAGGREQKATTGTGARRRSAWPWRRRKGRYGIAVVTLGAMFSGVLWLWPGRTTPPVSATAAPSVAVLPLASTDPRDTPLADGITEELIATLARVGDLRVIARTSVLAFRERPFDIRQIADSLEVDNVLEGTLQRSGSRLRVRLRLVDGHDGATRWSETYDRELRDVFVVQDEIAQSVAHELGLRLGAVEAARRRRQPTQNVAAYEFYLRGSDPVLLRTDSGALQMLEYFQRAIALDSTYAAAYAGLAVSYQRIRSHPRLGSFSQLHALAEEAALKAISLDGSLAQAHRIYGVLRLQDGDYAAGEARLERALALDPSQSSTYEALVELYLQTNRPAEALAQAERALEIDPLSPGTTAELARALLANGRCGEALARLQRIADVQPPLLRVAPTTAQCLAIQGRWHEAIAVMRPQAATHPHAQALLGYLLARTGQRGEALDLLSALRESWQRTNEGAVHVATIYAGLGDLDEAFLWLDRAVDDRSVVPRWGYGFVLEPIFEELHHDARFQRVRDALGI